MSHFKISLFHDLWNKPFPEKANVLKDFLRALSEGTTCSDPFFNNALRIIRKEIGSDIHFQSSVRIDRLKEYWNILFPEALLIDKSVEDVLEDLRSKRAVSIKKPKSDPICNVPEEMTFTSNVLLTLPDPNTPLDELDIPENIKDEIPEILKEDQLFWFDHPVQIGEVPEKNEIIYGLNGLSDAFTYEKEMGNVDQNATLDVLLSVSVTHEGLQKIAAPYLEYELSKSRGIKDLNIFVFTEKDCQEILESYSQSSRSISEYFGVDGKYGRHYNFLKAVNALWRIAVNPKLKGTFKIDLDQVFPQKELQQKTSQTAFQHFTNPLWGAEAIDNEGNTVDLSMIAGALVNESDIEKSIYTPDVSIPNYDAPVSDLAFFKHLTMALSTRAEMGMRYKEHEEIDGKTKALSRIHVTGGTNGILLDALLKYRPFTPSFIGRAEDQAYILSVLNNPGEMQLRYYHEDGLIMRHDKHAFAGQSIEAAKDGTYIADILRVLYFSYYSEALPGGKAKTKESIYPFTGSYISHYPMTTAYMRFVYKLLEMYEEGIIERADQLLALGKERIGSLIEELENENVLVQHFKKEKEQWNIYYDEITTLERNINKDDQSAIQKCEKIRQRLKRCQIN